MNRTPSDQSGRGRRLWPALLLGSTMLTAVTPALAQGDPELVVTAQKREENIQKVPMSIQALSTARLEELNVTDFDDYAKFLPSVAYQTFGPGSAKIYMRGVASGENRNHSGPLPSVGVYLDEQPITTIQGEIDFHVYDVARVEALAGPQGTLYGASSQAGTLRIITNKPNPAGFEAGYDLDVNKVTHGSTGYGAEGFVNQPLGDRAAIRLVGWAEHDAGYIDNVLGTRTFPTSGITISNLSRAENNYNEVDTYGGRAALKLDLDENWTGTVGLMAQDQKSEGLFSYDPLVGELAVTHFYPESYHDRWGQAALTIEGKISNFDLTYAGGFMKRKVDTELDYTDYAYFYDALFGYGAYFYDDAGNLVNPSQYIQGRDRLARQSHEFRIASPQDQRLRVVAGLFYQRQIHHIEQRYIVDGLASFFSVTGWPDTIWLTQQRRVDRDYAAFGEATFDLTDQFSITAGGRLFKARNGLEGFFGFASDFSANTGERRCFAPTVVPGSPCTNLDKEIKENGFTHKLNATYEIDDDRMIYATWSRGFRPGGINRRGTLPPYQADFLTNYEVGWKTSWAGGRLRFNGSIFMGDWKNYQFSFLGANGLTEIKNAGQARIKGVEGDLVWRPLDALTVSAAASYIDAKLAEHYCGTTDPAGNPITTCATPQAPDGTRLPVTPRFKGNTTVRYEFPLASMEGHVQGALVYRGSSWSDLRLADRATLGKQEDFTTVDLATGVKTGGWSFEAYVTNVFDEIGDVFRYAECAISVCGGQVYLTPIRPRTVGVRVGQRF